jgi:hypothetical protein
LCECAGDPYFIEFFCSLTDNANHLYNEEHDFALIESIMRSRDNSRIIPDLRYLFRKGVSLHISSYWTITSVALEGPRQFAVWCTVLQELQVDIDQFVDEELEVDSLGTEEWTKRALLNLFETWNRASSLNPGPENCACKECPSGENYSLAWSPWDIVVERIKQDSVVTMWDRNPSLCGICCLCSPLTFWSIPDENTLDEDSSNDVSDYLMNWLLERRRTLLELRMVECPCSPYRHLEGYPQRCEFCTNPSLGADAEVKKISIPGAFEPIYI